MIRLPAVLKADLATPPAPLTPVRRAVAGPVPALLLGWSALSHRQCAFGMCGNVGAADSSLLGVDGGASVDDAAHG